jgi:hypothetical protein
LSVYYKLINRQQNFKLRLLDLDVFKQVADLLTHYALNLVITEWLNTKIIRLAIEAEKEETVNFKLEEEAADCKVGSLRLICLLACALLLRYSLLYKH